MRKMLFTLLIVLCLVIGLFAQDINYPLGTDIYNEYGIPQLSGFYGPNPDVSQEAVTPALEAFINANIWDKHNLEKANSPLLNPALPSNIVLLQNAEVKVTFYGETAGYHSSLGYYTYDNDNPPTSTTDITEYQMLFPNVEDGTWNRQDPPPPFLPRGRTLNLGEFEAGTTIAWFIVANGWDRKGNGTDIKTKRPFYYSDSYLNPNGIKQSVLFPYIPEPISTTSGPVPSNTKFIIGFEDQITKPGGKPKDRDFDDVSAIIGVKYLGTSLDVNLIDFKTKYANGNVNINWSTASEVNNKGFILERKTGLSDWEEIASYYTDDRLLGYGSTTEQNDYSYIDTDIIPGNVYNYRISDVDQTNKVKVHSDNVVSISIPEEASNTAEKYDITNIYPNPFNPNTNISFDIATQCDVKIEVYDISGNKVDELMSGSKSAGSHTINWNASQFSTGVYFINFQANNQTSIQKCIFMK